MNDEVCFWHEYKNQSLLQVDTIIIGICNQAYPKYTQKVCISLEYLQKSLEIKFNFCLQRNTKAFYKLIVWLWVCIPRHPQSTQTTMLQYFCNISRKTSRMKYIFGLVVNARGFFKLIQLFKVCVALPKIASLLFLSNILRNKLVMKLTFHVQISMKACCRLMLWF